MKFVISREALLRPLQLVAGVVEKRQTLPVLSNILLVVKGQQLSLTGTDLEVELVGRVTLEEVTLEGEITVPGKKLMDIVRSLPDGSMVEFEQDEQRMNVRSGRSRFTLSSLPATEFPNIEDIAGEQPFTVEQAKLRRVIDRVAFAMAQQDVRYYLNGMSFEVDNNEIKTVATDGHRLAIAQKKLSESVQMQRQLIIPRKGVQEIMRLLPADDELLTIQFGANHVRIQDGEFTFTSKLVDGRFPDYRRVLPRGGDKLVTANREWLRSAFQRVSILSNEKFRGVRLNLSNGFLKISANNPEQEQAEEVVEVGYQGDDLEIGFNVSYVLDVLNTLKTEDVQFTLADSNSSALIVGAGDDEAMYVVMRMRL
ncbi:MAG: DNA polymerase III subunit beta [Oleispira sp.]|nr:DNA polymerase III subunit beta [Oleispira sp.]